MRFLSVLESMGKIGQNVLGCLWFSATVPQAATGKKKGSMFPVLSPVLIIHPCPHPTRMRSVNRVIGTTESCLSYPLGLWPATHLYTHTRKSTNLVLTERCHGRLLQTAAGDGRSRIRLVTWRVGSLKAEQELDRLAKGFKYNWCFALSGWANEREPTFMSASFQVSHSGLFVNARFLFAPLYLQARGN